MLSDLNKNLVLIGMPGVGKSTVGVLLAKQLGYSFLDTDILIQTAEGKTLQQLIQDRGLSGFCDLEEEYILSVSVVLVIGYLNLEFIRYLVLVF